MNPQVLGSDSKTRGPPVLRFNVPEKFMTDDVLINKSATVAMYEFLAFTRMVLLRI